jgi:anti-sigma regulatory factor (Ser/Thr protein kinase)
MAAAAPLPQLGFRHEAVMYAGPAEFLARLMPYVESALERDEPIMVALPRVHLDAMATALGSRRNGIELVAMEVEGRNPSRIIGAWREFVDRRPADGRAIHGIGEPVWAERSEDEVIECHLHESLLNDAFADVTAFTLVCPYDVDSLDAATVAEARRTHPYVLEAGVVTESAGYDAAHVRDELFQSPLPPSPVDAEEMHVDVHTLGRDLSWLRRIVAEHGERCGLSPTGVGDLVLAIDELVVNGLRHGGGQATVRLWADDAGAVCEVVSPRPMTDPMVGRLNSDFGERGGRGLWLVNHVCDLVQARSTPQGTQLRVYVHR